MILWNFGWREKWKKQPQKERRTGRGRERYFFSRDNARPLNGRPLRHLQEKSLQLAGNCQLLIGRQSELGRRPENGGDAVNTGLRGEKSENLPTIPLINTRTVGIEREKLTFSVTIPCSWYSGAR